MTASNHALTGALIAAVVVKPELAVPLAFLAHFAMDGIPHFGVSSQDVQTRNQNRVFKNVLIFDCILAALLLILIPLLLRSHIPIWVCAASMLACMSPDLVWGWHFYYEVWHKRERRKRWFSNMHKKIQWSESYPGAVVEFVWFVLIFSLTLYYR